jgi:branched-chain amino acid transport system substrate-binding protein
MKTSLEVSRRAILGVLGVTAFVALPSVAYADTVLKIGVLGVMSGPAASWGLVNKYCAETSALMWNAKGGVDIGGEKYKIEIVSIDDKNDPKLTVAGAQRLINEEGIKYIIGPNVDTTAASVRPVAEAAGAMYFPYAFSKDLYAKPASQAVLSQIASWQTGPILYKYLMDKKGVKSIAFVARNESDPLNQRKEGVAAAQKLGLTVVSSEDTYEPGTTDFFPVITKVVAGKPDLIDLSGVAPADSPLLIKAARDLGYTGIIATETAQDAKILREVAGAAAKGFIVGGAGASTPEIQSAAMKTFIDEYKKHVGEWNDEAGTKVYALETILATLQKAGKAAIGDTKLFQKAMDDFSIKNPFVNTGGDLKFVGAAYFGQKRQIGVPMVAVEFDGNDFKTLFVGAVD